MTLDRSLTTFLSHTTWSNVKKDLWDFIVLHTLYSVVKDNLWSTGNVSSSLRRVRHEEVWGHVLSFSRLGSLRLRISIKKNVRQCVIAKNCMKRSVLSWLPPLTPVHTLFERTRWTTLTSFWVKPIWVSDDPNPVTTSPLVRWLLNPFIDSFSSLGTPFFRCKVWHLGSVERLIVNYNTWSCFYPFSWRCHKTGPRGNISQYVKMLRRESVVAKLVPIVISSWT